MGRLRPELLARIEAFCDEIVRTSPELWKRRCSRRLIDQYLGAGTSVGANAFEADAAVSPADFCRALGISVKEAAELRFWVRLLSRNGFLDEAVAVRIERESIELRSILNTMILRTRENSPKDP
jgi:four helix bundle protein